MIDSSNSPPITPTETKLKLPPTGLHGTEVLAMLVATSLVVKLVTVIALLMMSATLSHKDTACVKIRLIVHPIHVMSFIYH